MNFTALKQEVSDRGFAHLSDSRLGTYVNGARAEFDRMYLWPWREKTATGTSPLTISDLGTIKKVIDTGNSSNPLSRVDQQTLVETYGDLTTGGTPLFYYVTWSSGTPKVNTYPATATTLSVTYWYVQVDLSAGSDTPISPTECHYVICDMAVRQAMLDAGDFFSASMAQSEADRKLSQLLDQYPPSGAPDGPDAYVPVSGASQDW